MRYTLSGAGLCAVMLAVVPVRADDDARTPRARLAEIEAAQKAVSSGTRPSFKKSSKPKRRKAPLRIGSTAVFRRMSMPRSTGACLSERSGGV